MDIHMKRIHCVGEYAQVFRVKSSDPYSKDSVLKKGYA
jgi:hypothetical protein